MDYRSYYRQSTGFFLNYYFTEALFFDAHRSLRTIPVAKATSEGGSNRTDSDSDSYSEAEVVGTIHKSNASWFNLNVDSVMICSQSLSQEL